MKARNYAAIIAAIIIVSVIVGLAVQARTSNEPPAVVSAVAPVFPPVAVAANISGDVVIEVDVNAAGEITSARTVEGHPLLRRIRVLEETARRWRFTSATNARTARLTFAFRIMPAETAADELTPVFTPPYRVEVRHRPFEPIIDSDPPSYVRPTRQRRGRRAQ